MFFAEYEHFLPLPIVETIEIYAGNIGIIILSSWPMNKFFSGR